MLKKILPYQFEGFLVAIALPWFFWSSAGGVGIHLFDMALMLYLPWAYFNKRLQRPHWSAVAASLILIVPSLWSTEPGLSFTKGIHFAAILLTFSSIRNNLDIKHPSFWAPSLFFILFSIIVNNPISGNENLTGIVSGFFFIITPLPFALIPLVALGISRSRGPLLALTLVAPFLGKWKLIFFTICLALTLAYVAFSPSRVPVDLQLVDPGGGLGNRVVYWYDAIKHSDWFGSGLFTQTTEKLDNPHSMFFLMWKELGWILGTALIALLFTGRKLTALTIFILLTSTVDHWTMTMSGGQVVLALALFQKKEIPEPETSLVINRSWCYKNETDNGPRDGNKCISDIIARECSDPDSPETLKWQSALSAIQSRFERNKLHADKISINEGPLRRKESPIIRRSKINCIWQILTAICTRRNS